MSWLVVKKGHQKGTCYDEIENILKLWNKKRYENIRLCRLRKTSCSRDSIPTIDSTSFGHIL
jgi:hypothetical protein